MFESAPGGASTTVDGPLTRVTVKEEDRAVPMAYHCTDCGVGAAWRVTRRGDGVVGWACPPHLAAVRDGMQRDDKVTELVVVLIGKLLEWLRLGARLAAIARDDPAAP